MLRFIVLRGERALDNVAHSQHGSGIETVYIGKLLLQLENKQQTLINNVETQHKHRYLLKINW